MMRFVVVGLVVIATSASAADPYFAAAKKAIAATVSPDLFDASHDDIGPTVECFRKKGVTQKALGAATKAQRPSPAMVACYDETIGL